MGRAVATLTRLSIIQTVGGVALGERVWLLVEWEAVLYRGYLADLLVWLRQI
jgi:hypothetical protein